MPKGIPNSKNPKKTEDNPYLPLFLHSLREAVPTLKLYSDERLLTKIGDDKADDLSLQFFSVIVSGGGDTLDSRDKQELAYQCWMCLQSYLEGMNQPVSLNQLMNSIPLLYAAVDRCYPGYIDSKLLRYIIGRR